MPDDVWYGWAEKTLAVHEAAHAVAGWRAGLEVQRIELRRGWWSGRMDRGTTYVGGEVDVDDAEALLAYLTVFLVSRPAEERFIEENRLGSSFSYQNYSCGGDEEDFDEESRGSGLTYGFVLARSEALVDACWAQILEVGAELFERERLSGRSAR